MSEEEKRMASIALAPLAYGWLGRFPPPPDPGALLAGPAALVTLVRVMGRTKTQEQSRQAIHLILVAGGWDESTAWDVATRMYP